jgi:two-component system, LuxR family, sensor kinase FixL
MSMDTTAIRTSKVRNGLPPLPLILPIYVLGYVLLDWASYIHPVPSLAITPWNPQPALSLGLLFCYGLNLWPALLVASWLAEVLVRGGLEAPLAALGSAAILTAGYSVVAATLLGPLRFDPNLTRLRDLAWLFAGVVTGALAIAAIYVGIHVVQGKVWGEDLPDHVLRMWIGDVNGIMVLAPLLLTLRNWRPHAAWRLPHMEVWLQAGSLALALWVIFGIEITDRFKVFYLLFLPVTWIAMRHGLRGAALALLLVQTALIGILVEEGYKTSVVVEFQFLMLALAVVGLFAGMAVSERERARAELAHHEVTLNQALRLAGAGEMASAMAHELNQPLSAIVAYARSCQLMSKNPGEYQQSLSETVAKMATEASRAGSVVHRLRDFYRGGTGSLDSIPVRDLVQAVVVAATHRAQRYGIAIEAELADMPHMLMADRIQTETILHNLLSNAIEALIPADVPRKRIRVSTQAKGSEIEIRVCDNGPGIAEDIRPRLFEPFATSKPDGMGLGLVISRNLAESHGGRLSFTEDREGGACFLLTLPADQEPHDDPT